MSVTGTVKKFMDHRGFGFITPDDGGEDVFIHTKQCNGAEHFREGDAVSYDNEWSDRKEKMQGPNCTVIGDGGCGGGGGKGVEEARRASQTSTLSRLRIWTKKI